ncbi:MAG: dTDP-4-dehydrorhamnose reductase [Planctomycetia bacterium]|nr:dTDP-4-dehydrorhamnose reductase [Planctomycetia bacterium]
MKILLFGTSGQVGWELSRSLAPLGHVVAPGRAAADLEQPQSIREAVRRERPDVVVNAAAYTAVDRAEAEPQRARLVNAASVGAMAEEVARCGGWLVHYSTDYVFDGGKTDCYEETDPVNPLGVYGATKAEGERLIAEAGCRHLIFRTSWVYSDRGHNFLRTILRLAGERSELSVVDDQVGAPTSASLLAFVTAEAVRRMGGAEPLPPSNGIYHVAASGATSWHGYARLVVAEAIERGMRLELRPDDIRPIPTSAYQTPARRPANSRLRTAKVQAALAVSLPPWEHDARRTVAAIARPTTS